MGDEPMPTSTSPLSKAKGITMLLIDKNRICLFNSFTCSVEEISKFNNCYEPYGVATTQNKIFGINNVDESFEIYDLDTRQISEGPDPLEWRYGASVAYFKGKLYYLGGKVSKIWKNTNRVDVLIDEKWQTGPTFPLLISDVRVIACDGILYVIDGWDSKKIYRLSDDEREWIEVGKIPELRGYSGVASLNGRIYIAGGENDDGILKSCLCFNPSAPVDSRISRVSDMNCARYRHSLVAANGKLYAIGGITYSNDKLILCGKIEEYDPRLNKWQEKGITMLLIDKNRICLFNSFTCSVEEIAKFNNCYEPYGVATTQNKIFAISDKNKSFEIYDLDTRRISEGPDPPKWRQCASVAYFKDKLYYLSGWDSKTYQHNQVDVLIDGKWQTGPSFLLPTIIRAQIIKCDEILYVIEKRDNSNKIYRLSDDERKWIEIGEIPEQRKDFGVASLNGKIYITGGFNDSNVLKFCLCFDPLAPVNSRIYQITDMNYGRHEHSLIAVNEKLYAIGGFQLPKNFCNSIEEYDPETNEWREVGKLT